MRDQRSKGEIGARRGKSVERRARNSIVLDAADIAILGELGAWSETPHAATTEALNLRLCSFLSNWDFRYVDFRLSVEAAIQLMVQSFDLHLCKMFSLFRVMD